jgi:hypothetical protein
MTYVLAAIVGLHGLVHALGFVSSWRLAPVPLMTPTLLARIDPDGPLMHAIGLLWLLPIAGFVIGGIGIAMDVPLKTLLVASALLSLALCVAWWSDAKVGAIIDVAILLALIETAWVAQARTP